MTNDSLIEQIRLLRFPDACSDKLSQVNNNVVDACINIIRQHAAAPEYIPAMTHADEAIAAMGGDGGVAGNGFQSGIGEGSRGSNPTPPTPCPTCTADPDYAPCANCLTKDRTSEIRDNDKNPPATLSMGKAYILAGVRLIEAAGKEFEEIQDGLAEIISTPPMAPLLDDVVSEVLSAVLIADDSKQRREYVTDALLPYFAKTEPVIGRCRGRSRSAFQISLRRRQGLQVFRASGPLSAPRPCVPERGDEMQIDERAFEAFMRATHENGPTGLGLRKCLEAYEAAKETHQPVGVTEVDKAVAHLASLGGSKTDWRWCHSNPEEAAALIDRLNATITTKRESSNQSNEVKDAIKLLRMVEAMRDRIPDFNTGLNVVREMVPCLPCEDDDSLPTDNIIQVHLKHVLDAAVTLINVIEGGSK